MDQRTPSNRLDGIDAPSPEMAKARVEMLKQPKLDRYAGLAAEIEALIRAGRLDGIPEIARQIAIMILGTPAAEWREKGLPDPHGTRYNRQRAATAGGHMTDDEVANAVFMVPNIENQTIAKDRIRWLSRALVEAERNVRHWRGEVGKLRSKDPAAIHERAFELTPAAQHDLAAALAANVGYVLAEEPQHPDSPHREQPAATRPCTCLPLPEPPSDDCPAHGDDAEPDAPEPIVEFGTGWAKVHFRSELTDQDRARITAAARAPAKPSAPHAGPFTHWPRASIAADTLVTVAQLDEALTKLREIAASDEHGRYGRLARETIACLAPSAAPR